jgi:hypothetical protein
MIQSVFELFFKIIFSEDLFVWFPIWTDIIINIFYTNRKFFLTHQQLLLKHLVISIREIGVLTLPIARVESTWHRWL